MCSHLRRPYRIARRLVGAAVGLLLAGYLALVALHFQPMVIVTGSMQRTLPVGSLVVDRTVPPRTLEVGDIISFEKPIGARELATHRIVRIQRSRGFVVYRTKGDSNPVADPWAITFKQGMVAHKLAFHVPYLGYVLLFARSRLGIIAIVGAACLTLVVSLLQTIAQAALLKESRRREAEGVRLDGVVPDLASGS